jgi:ferredoxin
MVNVSDTINKIRYTTRTGLRPVMSCTQCGVCERTCPVGIDLKRLCLETRRVLQKTGELPSGYYEYWLNDMRHGNGEESALFIPNFGYKYKYIYFPGCQMGASDPDYVVKSYEWLCLNFPGDTALMLYCCGAPAHWAGDEPLHSETMVKIRTVWRESGKPSFIVACPTCAEMFINHFPEINIVSLWGLMAERVPERNVKLGTVSVFDPCSSKYVSHMQRDIRMLIKKTGYDIEELKCGGELARCCGYGGLVYSSNPGLVELIGEHNRALGDLEFVTYCTNCRDSFATHKKPSRHILDILFFDGESRNLRCPADLSGRRKNRVALKRALLNETQGSERLEEMTPYNDITLIISDETREKLDKRLILEENVKMVIHCAETSKKRLYCYEDDIYTAHQEQGKVTFWAQYRPVGNGAYLLLNAYLHRLRIEG